MPGLHRNFDIDAYITADLNEIRVDEGVYSSRENRYRFSLAHELAHRVLHADVFKQLQFETIAQWKTARSLIPEREYRFIEWHANEFAGLVLVPPDHLAAEFETAKARVESLGFILADDPVAWDALELCLSERFVVSQPVIAKRGPADSLWEI
jgi:Zn-dependent peptidase ImmA (M78 family)